MPNLADLIEEYILSLIGNDGELNIQRANLASTFRCAPSQISYVIETRFTRARGYSVESRRGGGGYIRIAKMGVGPDDLLRVAESQIGDAIDTRTAEHVIGFLNDQGTIEPREMQLMLAAVRAVSHPDPRVRDMIRASILRNMLVALTVRE